MSTKTKLTIVEQRAKAYCETIRNTGTGQITIEWRKSRTWGSNPVIENYAGEKCCSVSGTGYCKESTALADVLRFLELSADDRNSVWQAGGAGVSSVVNALQAIGWKLEAVAKTKTADAYRVSRIH
jgi:hypothetical protein